EDQPYGVSHNTSHIIIRNTTVRIRFLFDRMIHLDAVFTAGSISHKPAENNKWDIHSHRGSFFRSLQDLLEASFKYNKQTIH
ncbi:hypothetical protein, partial [Proteiniphilum sp. UBA5510]|uniref:hypothetical protein n=1 Tax=Proteiniphilum sp. UBA5510 TaxID=1947286 RepID=UPI00257F6947